ncbi:hypothetical protein [Streptomyces candidus]|uniref:Lipoprotein n=1 Tax=Streptomyces candidus TaxID=67283 RepID=A0A7X0HH67_9ACTN|nr:hypothetical protein [Streptomyces candidus]MBB6437567.1 hypothetical protein [Streptomyces candidus]GHH53797.1 hypothetical protein GCM10018773_55850 [Streptomyces candidus]
MLPARAVRAAAALVLLAGAAVGCAQAGELKSAGAVPTAVGPVRLWPTLPPAKAPAEDYGVGETERAEGIEVPDGDVHKVDPVAVVKAETAAHPDTYSGPTGLYKDTVTKLDACREKPRECPVLPPYYRDLTGDGRDELIIGVTMPQGQLAIRAYLAEEGGLTRILGTSDAVISVAFAGRDLVLRVPAGISGYEYRTAWTWDARQHAMLATQDQIVHSGWSPGTESGTAPETGTESGTGHGTGPGTGPGMGPEPESGSEPAPGAGLGPGGGKGPTAGTVTESERAGRGSERDAGRWER